jgi:hypothetical protein
MYTYYTRELWRIILYDTAIVWETYELCTTVTQPRKTSVWEWITKCSGNTIETAIDEVSKSWSATLSIQMYHVSETFWNLHSDWASIPSYQQMAALYVCCWPKKSICVCVCMYVCTHIQRVLNFVDSFTVTGALLAAKRILILPTNQNAWWPIKFETKGSNWLLDRLMALCFMVNSMICQQVLAPLAICSQQCGTSCCGIL